MTVLDVPYLSHLTDGLRKALLGYDKVSPPAPTLPAPLRTPKPEGASLYVCTKHRPQRCRLTAGSHVSMLRAACCVLRHRIDLTAESPVREWFAPQVVFVDVCKVGQVHKLYLQAGSFGGIEFEMELSDEICRRRSRASLHSCRRRTPCRSGRPLPRRPPKLSHGTCSKLRPVQPIGCTGLTLNGFMPPPPPPSPARGTIDRWQCVAAAPTYNPLGTTLTFVSESDVLNAVSRL